LDLIVRRSDQEKWMQLARQLGCELVREGPTFLQFNAPQRESFPLDLMMVGEETFSKMEAQSIPIPSVVPCPRAVSLMHLLALKCHAIKHGHSGRIVKDAEDVKRLINNNKINPEAPEVRELFQKHGTDEFYQKSDEPVEATNSLDLELPDWSGMEDSDARITPAAALRLCENYPRLFPKAGSQHGKDRPEKCVVEFVL
jgi:hypothetical protein